MIRDEFKADGEETFKYMNWEKKEFYEDNGINAEVIDKWRAKAETE